MAAKKDTGNIANEFGHTYYPKWIEDPTLNPPDNRVIVQDEEEEKAVLAKGKTEEKKPQGWDKK